MLSFKGEVNLVTNDPGQVFAAVDNNEVIDCGDGFGGGFLDERDGWGNPDTEDFTLLDSLRCKPDLDLEVAWVVRGTLDSAIGVSLEAFGEILEFKDGVIEPEHSKLHGVELADKGGRGDGRTDEVVGVMACAGEGDQQGDEKISVHSFIYKEGSVI